MSAYTIRKTANKGQGLFSTRDIRKGEHILHKDLTNLRKYTLNEASEHPDGDHADYVGYGKYVIDYSPGSYINHSCDPNCYVKAKRIAVRDIYAFKNIKAGEELTCDYAAQAVDQFAGKGFWVLDCHCGSRNCRGKVTGDLFQLPKDLQKIYYPNLPPSIKRKYREQFRILK